MIRLCRSEMGDREDKVAKAREKLEKFRRNKNKEPAAAAPPVDSAPANSSMKVAADEPAAVSSENTHVNQTDWIMFSEKYR